MKKARFDYRRLMAVAAVLAIAMVQSATAFRGAPATSSSLAVADPDLNNEVRTLSKYFDDLIAFQNECAQLSKRGTLEHIHINPLQVKADDLKGRLSDVQNAIREVVRKLKAANAWDDLDTATASKIADASQRAQFQQESFKQLLEDSTNLSSHANEIDIPLDNLRKKVASRTLSPSGDGALTIVPAAYQPPTPMKFVSLACTIARIRLGITLRLGGIPPGKLTDQVTCQCGGAGSACPAT